MILHITCLTNDYGYDKWIKKSIEYHIDRKFNNINKLIRQFSNMIEAAKEANKKNTSL